MSHRNYRNEWIGMIGDWCDNKTVQVQLSVSPYGDVSANVRNWYRRGGRHLPSTEGINIPAREIDDLIELLQKAQELAPIVATATITPRMEGSNPRALGINPRALGTNPRAAVDPFGDNPPPANRENCWRCDNRPIAESGLDILCDDCRTEEEMANE